MGINDEKALAILEEMARELETRAIRLERARKARMRIMRANRRSAGS
jgi:exonuclease VII small subunit